jgi:hypothetical protein
MRRMCNELQELKARIWSLKEEIKRVPQISKRLRI